MQRKKQQKKRLELVVYNTHDPDQFTVIHCNGFTISADKYEIVTASCGVGPYLAFFLEVGHKFIYRLRGPYHGIDLFYIIDSTHIPFDEHSEIRKAIILKINEIRARGK